MGNMRIIELNKYSTYTSGTMAQWEAPICWRRNGVLLPARTET